MTGLFCKCGCSEWHTLETRPSKDGIKRRKECVECGTRITTYEAERKAA